MHGLLQLHLSGSDQFSTRTFKQILDGMPRGSSPDGLLILDLRNDLHGFLNGAPAAWRDWDLQSQPSLRSAEGLLAEEAQRFSAIEGTQQKVWLAPGDLQWRGTVEVTIESAQTEPAWLQSQKVGYTRMPIPLWVVPTDDTIDGIVKLVAGMSPRRWIHVHDGWTQWGTVIVMTMIDMMRNAQQVPLQDILVRQSVLAGLNLNEIPHSEQYDPGPWDRYYPPSEIRPPYRFDGDSLNGADPMEQNDPLNPFFLPYDATVVEISIPGETPEHVESVRGRLTFLQDFYRYCRIAGRKGYQTSWSQWMQEGVSEEVISQGTTHDRSHAMLQRTWRMLNHFKQGGGVGWVHQEMAKKAE